MLDVARFVAAVGVIGAHVIDEFFPDHPAWVLGSYAVPFYLFVAIFFTVRGLHGRPDRSVRSYLVGRVMKLYVPFLLWNVLYDVFHVVRHPEDSFTPPWQTLWAAVFTHLYFPMFLLLVTAILSPFVRPLMRRRRMADVTVAVLIIAAIVVAYSPQPTWLADTQKVTHETLWNDYRAIPSTCLAIAAALLVVRRGRIPSVSGLGAACGMLLMLSCLAIEYRVGQQGLLRAGSGLGLAMIAFWNVRAPWLATVASLGRLSFGVYLTHVMVIRLAMSGVKHFGWQHDLPVAIAVGLIGLLGGLMISASLSRSAKTRWMIGCEKDRN